MTTQPQPRVLDIEPATTAVVRDTVPMAELPALFDRAFGVLPGTIAGQGVAITGAAFARYHGQPTDTAELEVGFPTAEAIQPDGDVHPSSLPGGRVARVEHHGSFDTLGDSWERLATWMAAEGHTPSDTFWEVYVTEPSPDMDPADLVTELSWLLA